jgi:hypothetical protein
MPTTFLFEVAVLQAANKGQHMNSVEKYIHNEKYKGTQIKNNVKEKTHLLC